MTPPNADNCKHQSQTRTMLELSFHAEVSPQQILYNALHVSAETVPVSGSTTKEGFLHDNTSAKLITLSTR